MNTLTRVVSGTRAGYAMGTALVLLLAGAAPGQTAQSKPTSAPSVHPSPPTHDKPTTGADASPATSAQTPQRDAAGQVQGVQPDVQRRAGGYWLSGRRGYGRRGGGGSQYASSGMQPHAATVPPNPTSVRATHNYDGSVTVTWYVPAGHGAVGDVYQVGRRLPDQSDFWNIGETTAPAFTDRSLPRGTSSAQYEVVVRRNGVYGAISALASVSLSHAWARRAPVVLPAAPESPTDAEPTPANPNRNAPAPKKSDSNLNPKPPTSPNSSEPKRGSGAPKTPPNKDTPRT